MILKTSKKIYAHVDCDSFFASCEVYKNPFLENKYVCVGSEIIVAASYNAKKLGVGVGTPIWEARKVLGPNAVFIPPDMSLYGKISKKLMNFLSGQTCNVEKFSVDEAFVEITGLAEAQKMQLEEYIEYLQKKILVDIGIPVSIGVSNTRLKAKIFSKIYKPYGYYIGIDTAQEDRLFSGLPLGDIPFIGRGYQNRLRYKAQSIMDYKRIPFFQIQKLLGKNGAQIWLELHGVSSMCFQKTSLQKSISRTRSFNAELTGSKDFLWKQILMNTQRIFEELTEKKYEIRNISLQLKAKDGQKYGAGVSFPDYTNDRKYIHAQLKKLFEKIYDSSQLYRRTGVFSSDIRSHTPKQLTLGEKSHKKFISTTKLEHTLSDINRKYGKGKICFGA